MKLEELFERVKSNVERLKPLLTDSDKDMLVYDAFQPFIGDKCLLGQLTGSAKSERAKELLEKDIRASYNLNGWLEVVTEHSQGFRLPSFDRLKFYDVTEDNPPTFAPLELFLMLNTNSDELYEYLKDQRETFEPKLK